LELSYGPDQLQCYVIVHARLTTVSVHARIHSLQATLKLFLWPNPLHGRARGWRRTYEDVPGGETHSTALSARLHIPRGRTGAR